MCVNQKGIVSLLILISAIGFLIFIGLTSTTFFKDKLFSKLFPKEQSQAASGCWAIGSSCDSGCQYSSFTTLDSWNPSCTKTCKPSTTYYKDLSGTCSIDGSGKCIKAAGLVSQNICSGNLMYPYGDSTCTNAGGWCVEGIDYTKGTNCSVQNVASSVSECYWLDTTPKNVKALAIIYDPILSDGRKLHDARSWQDPNILLPQVVTSLRVSSGGYADYTIVSTSERNEWPKKMDGFRYDESTYNACLSNSSNCHSPDEADYAQIWSDLNICSRVTSGEFDEVFIYSPPYSGIDEYALKIPNDQMPYNNPTNYWFYQGRKKNIPDCNGKTVFVMGWNYERGLAEAIHSYGHKIENALGLTVGRGFWDGCNGNSDFDHYTCIQKDVSPTTPVTVAGCGNVHYPPNGAVDYDYANSTVVSDACESWTNYPFTSKTINTRACEAWGCTGDTQLIFLKWWMNHLPRKDGITSNSNLKNWWKYIVDFDNAVAEAKGTLPTPTPTPTPPPKPGDINGDGCVNVVDFSILLSKWGTNDTGADLNLDGTVNVVDFSILLSNWGNGC